MIFGFPNPVNAKAARVVAPRLGPPKYVAGPPKRFAQGMGASVREHLGDARRARRLSASPAL